MPSMYEIYAQHADEYDALVDREDHEQNLRALLRSQFAWGGATVVEAGIGTGRLTRFYVDLVRAVLGFDRENHMLRQAAANLQSWTDRVTLSRAEHHSLPVANDCADVFIEGWAFGHAILDHAEDVRGMTRRLVGEADRVTRSGSPVIIIETLGTNADEPTPPLAVLADFYSELEQKHGFGRQVVRTDYRFDSVEQAVALCGFFFGEEMRASVRERAQLSRPNTGGVIVPEFTGLWIR